VLEYRAGNINLAVELFDRLVRMQPDNLAARQMLARALARQGSDRQIADRFDADASQPYASPYMLRIVGRAWQRLGEKARGAVYLARAARLADNGAAPLPSAAAASVLAVRYGEAPNLAQTAVPYIRALLHDGRVAEAQGAADRLRDANPGAAEAHLLAGDVRAVGGDAAGALADYQNGAAIRFNEPVLSRMDAALRALGRTREADAMTSRYLAQNPASVLAMKLLAAGWRKGPRTDATTMLERALAARGQSELLPV
jgi:tetratricopeptide (TPR) repeat protein